jgi:LysM repeat protein
MIILSRSWLLPALFTFFFTMSNLTARYSSSSDVIIDELRLELSDVKHDLHSARIEIQLLEEKLSKQERAFAANKNVAAKPSDTPALRANSDTIDALEKKITHFEKLLDKVVADLRTLNISANQAVLKTQELELALGVQEKKFDEVVKLKSTLSSISKAMGQSNSNAQLLAATNTYRVKAGDSLEKIGRAHHTSIEAIKQLNHLTNDKIVIGQELKLPDK